ncbi:hypothetical protein [Rhodococcus sp. NPDC004095]
MLVAVLSKGVFIQSRIDFTHHDLVLPTLDLLVVRLFLQALAGKENRHPQDQEEDPDRRCQNDDRGKISHGVTFRLLFFLDVDDLLDQDELIVDNVYFASDSTLYPGSSTPTEFLSDSVGVELTLA